MDTFDSGDLMEEAAGIPEVDPTDGGQVEPQGDIAPEPEPNYLDLDAYGNHFARVKVDGEELEVPVAEALQGYQRQADYTRKTQELSERSQQVQFWESVDQAMQVDPQATMSFLQNHYGIGQAQVAANTSYEEPEEDWFADPSEKRIAQLEQRLQSVTQHFEQQQASQLLDQVVGNLQQKYGEDFNAREVISAALDRNISDPRMLESVYKEIAFDRLMAKQAAQADAEAKREQDAERRRQAAQDAATAVSQGSGSNGAVQTPTPASRPKTIQEAWALARQQTAS
ncbi:MAG: hypothetical protein ACO3O3_03065 [Ilumatobacteraceae bacterium]